MLNKVIQMNITCVLEFHSYHKHCCALKLLAPPWPPLTVSPRSAYVFHHGLYGGHTFFFTAWLFLIRLYFTGKIYNKLLNRYTHAPYLKITYNIRMIERQRHRRDTAHPMYETIDNALAAPPV